MTSQAVTSAPATVAVPWARRPVAAWVTRCDPPVVLTLVWVPLVLLLDVGAGIWAQRALGVGTWLLLLALLRREAPLVRAQVAVVVAFATAVEYTFSPLLGSTSTGSTTCRRSSRRDTAWSTCARSRSAGRRGSAGTRHLRSWPPSWSAGPYAAWGLVGSGRPDALGAFWYLCLLGFLVWGRSRTLYVGAFLVVTYLELLGTWLGTWAWQTHDPTGLVTIGNPPSGAAGGYGWFDLAAVLAGPAVLAAAHRLRHRHRA